MKLYTEKELRKLERKKRREKRGLKMYAALMALIASGGFYTGIKDKDIDGLYLGFAIVLIIFIIPLLISKGKYGRALSYHGSMSSFLSMLVLFVVLAWVLSHFVLMAIE